MSNATPSTPPQPRTPKSRPGVIFFAALFTVVLLFLAAVAIHDILVTVNYAPAPSWFATSTRYIAHLTFGAWVLPLGILLTLCGLWAIISAFIPAGKSHIPLHSHAAVWMRPVDICRMSTHAACTVLGVIKATTVLKGKKITVSIVTAGPANDEIVHHVQEVVAQQLNYINRPFTLTVRPVTGRDHS